MRDRLATARRRREQDDPQIESARMRKLPFAADDTGRWLLTGFREALAAPRLDGHLGYLSANLLRHIAARVEAVTLATRAASPRLVSERRALLERLDAVAEIAARVDDAVSNALSIGGDLGDLERVVLTRMLGIIDAELAHASRHDIELLMREHWVDVGGSG